GSRDFGGVAVRNEKRPGSVKVGVLARGCARHCDPVHCATGKLNDRLQSSDTISMREVPPMPFAAVQTQIPSPSPSPSSGVLAFWRLTLLLVSVATAPRLRLAESHTRVYIPRHGRRRTAKSRRHSRR